MPIAQFLQVFQYLYAYVITTNFHQRKKKQYRKQLYESADKREYSVGRHPFTHECKKNSLIWLDYGRHGCFCHHCNLR